MTRRARGDRRPPPARRPIRRTRTGAQGQSRFREPRSSRGAGESQRRDAGVSGKKKSGAGRRSEWPVRCASCRGAHRKGRDVGDGLARAPAGGARAFESIGSRRRAPLSAPAADRSRRARRDRPFRCCCESLALPSPRLCCPHHPTGPARRRDVRARGRRARADDTRARASPGGDSHPAKLTPLDAARKWGGDATASEVVAFFFRGPEREERDTARYRRSVTPEFKKQSRRRRRNFHLSWRLGYFRARHFPVCIFFHVRLAASVALTGQSETRIFRL